MEEEDDDRVGRCEEPLDQESAAKFKGGTVVGVVVIVAAAAFRSLSSSLGLWFLLFLSWTSVRLLWSPVVVVVLRV